MFYARNPVEISPGMVFFLHMILMNSDAGRAMTPSTLGPETASCKDHLGPDGNSGPSAPVSGSSGATASSSA